MPFALLSLAILILSQAAIFIRFAQTHAAAIGFWRMLAACVLLVPVLVHRREHLLLFKTDWRRKLELMLCGFFLYLHFYTWFLSVHKTSVANAMILFSTNPLYTAIGAFLFFQEKIYPRHIFSLLLCFSGLFVMMKASLDLRPESFTGDLLAFVCAVLFSCYILSSKNLRKSMPNPPFIFGIYFFCTFFFGITMLVENSPFGGYGAGTWAAIAALAVGCTLLGHAVLTYCLQFFNVNLISCSTLVEPLLSALSAWIIFGEPLTREAGLGFAFVSVGILVLYSPYLYELLRHKRLSHKEDTPV